LWTLYKLVTYVAGRFLSSRVTLFGSLFGSMLLQDVGSGPTTASVDQIEQWSRVGAYGLLIVFIAAVWKKWLMFRWQHEDIRAADKELLDAAKATIVEQNKRIADLEAKVLTTVGDGDRRCTKVEDDWRGRLTDQRADLLGQLAEAKTQIILWRDAFLAAKGFAEKSNELTSQVLAAKKDG
jgi:hypothetical protein